MTLFVCVFSVFFVLYVCATPIQLVDCFQCFWMCMLFFVCLCFVCFCVFCVYLHGFVLRQVCPGTVVSVIGSVNSQFRVNFSVNNQYLQTEQGGAP